MKVSRVTLLLVGLIATIMSALQTATARPKLYVLHSAADTMSVIDVATHEVIKTVTVGLHPHGIAAPASQDTLYVATEGDNSLAVVDAVHDTVTRTYPGFGRRPNEIDVTADGRFVYVPALGDGVYEVFDTAEEKIVHRIPTDGMPHNVVVSPDDRYMYLAPMEMPPRRAKELTAQGFPTSHNRKIYIVDARAHTIVDSIATLNAPRPVVVSPDGRRLYVNTNALLGFLVLDIKTRGIVSKAEYGLTPEERLQPSRSHGIGVTPDGREVWSTDINHGLVFVFDVTVDPPRQIARLETGRTPLWLTVSPDGGIVYVANTADDSISVFDVATKTETTRIQLERGTAPKRMLVVNVPDDARRPATRAIAFTHVNVVPMDSERILADHAVIVEGNRIASIGPADDTTIPDGARPIDGGGKYLMPGLAEMHSHLPSADMPNAVAENILFLYVANGVTTVRGMQGDPSQMALRDRVARGELVGPQMILGSPAMYGRNVNSADEAERLVREYKEQGFDLIKVHEGLAPEVYAAIATTAGELDLPFAGHVTDHLTVFDALDAGQATIEHLDNYLHALVPEEKLPDELLGVGGEGRIVALVDEGRLSKVVDATRQAGTAMVPTMVVWEDALFHARDMDAVLSDRPELQYLPGRMVQRWHEMFERRRQTSDAQTNRRITELRRKILRALHEGGVDILLGADSPQVFSVPGFAVHREMKFYVDVGMSPYEVLASGTRSVAEHFDAADEFGTVAVDKRADLVLVEANPLENIANASRIAGVMVDGRWLSAVEIQMRLDEIAARYRDGPGSLNSP
ncbi:MAG: amidohydrolase family protein [Planctomycetota bacterium]|jgi:YVTN family beta-propeller protein